MAFKCRLAARVLSVLALAGMPSAAFAYDWTVQAHVVVIETTYIGGAGLYFSIDQAGSASCPAGTWIKWNTLGADEPAQLANEQAELSTLLSAKLSGRTVRVYGNNADCSASYLWFDG